MHRGPRDNRRQHETDSGQHDARRDQPAREQPCGEQSRGAAGECQSNRRNRRTALSPADQFAQQFYRHFETYLKEGLADDFQQGQKQLYEQILHTQAYAAADTLFNLGSVVPV